MLMQRTWVSDQDRSAATNCLHADLRGHVLRELAATAALGAGLLGVRILLAAGVHASWRRTAATALALRSMP